MRIDLLTFGVLKEWLGPVASVDLDEGARVADLLSQLVSQAAGRKDILRSIAVSVNAEYAEPSRILHDGDEVGLLPPVSGGCAERTANPSEEQPLVVALTREPIDADALVTAAKRGEDGAVVVFDGIVRNHSRGRQTLYLDYEAYEEMALKQMNELARDAVTRFGIRHVTLVHRVGRLAIGETSVLVVVASAHRAQAYEASRWLIDTLKKTVPIWKKETFVDGVVWADGEPFPEGIAIPSAEGLHGE